MGDARAVGAQIRMRLPSLTPREGKVAADILARKDIDDTTPLRTVAEGTGVSESMVVKVAKEHGFAGFRAFRQGLVDDKNSDTAALRSEIGAQDTAGQIVQTVLATAMQPLEDTFAILDLNAVARARRNGARPIAVTNYADSPLAKIVDIMLFSTAQNNPRLGENVTARIAQRSLLPALCVAVAQRDRAAADASLAPTLRAVHTKRKA